MGGFNMSALLQNISKWEKSFSDFKQNLNELSEETKGDEYFKVVDKKYAIQVKDQIITPLIAIFDNMSEDLAGSGVFKQLNENLQLRQLRLQKAQKLITDHPAWEALSNKVKEAKGDGVDGFICVSKEPVDLSSSTVEGYGAYQAFVNDLNANTDLKEYLEKITKQEQLTEERKSSQELDAPESSDSSGSPKLTEIVLDVKPEGNTVVETQPQAASASGQAGQAAINNGCRKTFKKMTECLRHCATPFKSCCEKLSARMSSGGDNARGVELKES